MRNVTGLGVLCTAMSVACLTGILLLSDEPASAHTFKVLHSFCREKNCADGAGPYGLMMDQSGDIYGTTIAGGQNGFGSAYKLTPDGNGHYSFTSLFSFCQEYQCADGDTPYGPLIIDTAGDLYGVTEGGTNNQGLAYELTPGNGAWSLKILYSFCSQQGCVDGVAPGAGFTYTGASSGQPYDGTSPLYGTTTQGGADNGGTVYSLQPGGSGWTEAALYSFANVTFPDAAMIMDASGNLYGTLTAGGRTGRAGGVFELDNNGGNWTETDLVDFCSPNCDTGALPDSSLLLDSSGNLWGTAGNGGYKCSFNRAGCGTVYELSPGANGYTTTAAHVFCQKKACKGGFGPETTPVMDALGDVFGSTWSDPVEHCGTLFKLNGTTFSVLHKFGGSSGCNAFGNLLLLPSGSLIGTTGNGGKNDEGGTIFEFTP